MSEISCETKASEADIKSAGVPLLQDDVVLKTAACAEKKPEHKSRLPECEIPTKKRKTRRGKSKRKHPYVKSNKVVKPEAPHNSNQFLLEDHGNIEELDENLKFADRGSTRTRDSSFSVDSDGEFYSSPDDEEQFLIKDFDDQYESVQAERLQSMSKSELIQEYLMLESKIELLTKHLYKSGCTREQIESIETDSSITQDEDKSQLQNEIERLIIENESLKRENDVLKNKTLVSCSSDSEDSETDSSDSCSSTSSCDGNSSRSASPLVDYSQTNGHASVDPV